MRRSDIPKQMRYAKGGMTSCGKKKMAKGGTVKSKGCGMARSRKTKIR